MAEEIHADQRRITVTENGPYEVAGLPLKRRRIVRSEQDEPLTWQTTERLAADETYWLCRCGQSGNKPFCDGSHHHAGADGAEFDGAAHLPDGTYEHRQKSYDGPGMQLRDDRSICAHAGFCTNRVTNVWKMVSKDATADTAVRAQAMAMVEHCPSGALTYRLPGDQSDVEPELPAQVGVSENGPLLVTGEVTVQLADGSVLERRNRMALCRCGQSASKPLCDGTHAKIGFKG